MISIHIGAAKMIPIFLFMLLLVFKSTFAARPGFIYQVDITDDADKKEFATSILTGEFKDVITLARVAVLTGSDCGEVRAEPELSRRCKADSNV